MVGEVMEAEEVEEAFECVWWWWGMERMDEMEEEVDLRPRRPPEERRYEERGVSGEGESEALFPAEETLGRAAMCVEGVTPVWWVWTLEVRFAAEGRRADSGEEVCSVMVGDFAEEALEPPGERARLDVSLIQLRRVARWVRNGGWYFRRRLETKPFGLRRSGFVETTWSMLACDRRLVISLGGGGGRDEEPDNPTSSLATGGGGRSASGSGELPDSVSFGRSEGAPIYVSGANKNVK